MYSEIMTMVLYNSDIVFKVYSLYSLYSYEMERNNVVPTLRVDRQQSESKDLSTGKKDQKRTTTVIHGIRQRR